jgi:hypothetical protein
MTKLRQQSHTQEPKALQHHVVTSEMHRVPAAVLSSDFGLVSGWQSQCSSPK